MIVDGGLASRKNLEAIRAAGLRYLVNNSRPGRKALAEEFQRDDLFERLEARGQKARPRTEDGRSRGAGRHADAVQGREKESQKHLYETRGIGQPTEGVCDSKCEIRVNQHPPTHRQISRHLPTEGA